MRTFNLEKCLKEIDHQWSNYKGDYSRYYIDGYYQAQKDCLEIIKSNIQKKPEIRSAPDTMINSQYTSVRGWK
jgi:hypothetical protein